MNFFPIVPWVSRCTKFNDCCGDAIQLVSFWIHTHIFLFLFSSNGRIEKPVSGLNLLQCLTPSPPLPPSPPLSPPPPLPPPTSPQPPSAPSVLPPSPSPPPEICPGIAGDVDLNGLVNVLDLVAITNFILGTGVFVGNECTGDFDGNGVINVSVCRARIGFTNSLPFF